LGEDVLKQVTQLINSTYETGGWLRDLSYNDCFKEEAKATKCSEDTYMHIHDSGPLAVHNIFKLFTLWVSTRKQTFYIRR
jgi:hypothetical protein